MTLVLLKHGIKFGIAGGAIYWSIQQGIWGTMDEGSEAMLKLKSTLVVPSAGGEVSNLSKPKAKPVASPPPPPASVEPTTPSPLVGGWNSGVKTVFSAAAKLPESASGWSQRASSMVKNMIVDK